MAIACLGLSKPWIGTLAHAKKGNLFFFWQHFCKLITVQYIINCHLLYYWIWLAISQSNMG